MKRILLFLALLMTCLVAMGQSPSINDTSSLDTTYVDTCFTQKQILGISETLDSLFYLTAIQDTAITDLETVIEHKDEIIRLDSLHLIYKDDEINALNRQVDLHQELLQYSEPKWYNKPIVGFAGGVVSTILIANLILGTVR